MILYIKYIKNPNVELLLIISIIICVIIVAHDRILYIKGIRLVPKVIMVDVRT